MAAAKPFIPTLTDGVFRRIWSRQRPAQHADSDLCRRSPGSLSKSTPEDRRDGNQAWKRRPVNLLQGLCDNRRQVPLATGTLELHKRQNSPKNSTLAGACTVVACTLWPELEPCLCERGVSLPARLLPSRSQIAAASSSAAICASVSPRRPASHARKLQASLEGRLKRAGRGPGMSLEEKDLQARACLGAHRPCRKSSEKRLQKDSSGNMASREDGSVQFPPRPVLQSRTFLMQFTCKDLTRTCKKKAYILISRDKILKVLLKIFLPLDCDVFSCLALQSQKMCANYVGTLNTFFSQRG